MKKLSLMSLLETLPDPREQDHRRDTYNLKDMEKQDVYGVGDIGNVTNFNKTSQDYEMKNLLNILKGTKDANDNIQPTWDFEMEEGDQKRDEAQFKHIKNWAINAVNGWKAENPQMVKAPEVQDILSKISRHLKEMEEKVYSL